MVSVATNRIMAVIVVLVSVGIVVFFIAVSATERPIPHSAPGARRIAETYWCGVEMDDAVEVGMAVKRGDTAAIAGLISRGKAYQVEAGTEVSQGIEIDFGISAVVVDSGYHVGRRCYIPTRAIR